jgi:hypothetical protein
MVSGAFFATEGYSIEVLADKSTYIETAYLILYGELHTEGLLFERKDGPCRLTMLAFLRIQRDRVGSRGRGSDRPLRIDRRFCEKIPRSRFDLYGYANEIWREMRLWSSLSHLSVVLSWSDLAQEVSYVVQ